MIMAIILFLKEIISKMKFNVLVEKKFLKVLNKKFFYKKFNKFFKAKNEYKNIN